MRHWRLGLASLLTGALLLVSLADAESADKKQGAAGCSKETQVNSTDGAQGAAAQPPADGFKGKKGKKGKGGDGFAKGGKGKGFGKGGAIGEAQIVDRLLSFDKNNDGKVTKEELPERMQDLIARGDTNKDGALDKDEIRKLAVTLAAEGLPGGFGGRGGFGGPGFGGRPGFGGGPGFGGKGPPRGGFGPFAVERTLADLNLPDKTKTKAEAIVKGHEENVHKLLELARTDLLVKMKDVLSEQEFKTFKAAVERQPRATPPSTTSTGGTTRGTAAADLNRRLDRLMKELEDLRREIKR